MNSRRRLMLALTVSLLACDDAASGEVEDAGPTHEQDSGADDDTADFKGCPETTIPFALGLKALGESGRIQATLIEASEVPPLRYLNDWTIELAADADGAPLEDVSIESARPFMPIHGHDGNIQPMVRKLAAPGRFALNSLNFNMRGPWEVQLKLGSGSVGEDYVVFQICVAE